MSRESANWDALYVHTDYQDLVRRRSGIVLTLLGLGMAFFFSVPLIMVLWPDFFRARLGGATNVGLVYLIAQYLVGSIIAVRFTVLLRRLDGKVRALATAYRAPEARASRVGDELLGAA